MRKFGFLILTITWLFFHTSCRQSAQKETAAARTAATGATAQDTAAGASAVAATDNAAASSTPDTGSEHSSVTYARGFRIDYHNHYKLLRVVDSLARKTDTLEYLLVQRGYPVPAGYPKALVITIPLRTIVGMSSMHIALADFAEVADRIVGLGSLQYVTSPVVRKNIQAGKVVAVGMDANMNNEQVIAMHPDVVMVMGNPDAGFTGYKTLTEAGVPVLLNAEWLESTPLGRAEWVKVMGALVNKEKLVDRKFDSVAKDYNQLAQAGRQAAVKPRVIIGMPFKGSWFVPAGGSYMAQFLRDAGATYKWTDTKGGGSIPLNFEAVAPEALTADYWLNVGYVDSKADILSKDARYASFKPFKTGLIYNNDNRVNDLGSDDYWESGEVSPQVILADMIRILHPELLPAHTLFYYKQLK
jgi:iron complex transport system substrate-binding protein